MSKAIMKENNTKMNNYNDEIDLLVHYLEKNIYDIDKYDKNLKVIDKYIVEIKNSGVKFNSQKYFQLFTYSQFIYSVFSKIVSNIDLDKIEASEDTKDLLHSFSMLNDDEVDNKDEINIEANANYEISGDIDIVSATIKDFCSRPILEPEEEKRLFLEYKENPTKKIKDLIIESNLRLVVKYAKKFINGDIPFIDLLQEGSLGLIRAVDLYDPERGFKFSTYATYWIKQSIIRAIYDKGRNIRIPVHTQEQFSRYKKGVATLENKLGHIPNKEEIIKGLNITEEEYLFINQYLNDTVSINQKIGEEEDSELIEFIADTSNNPEDAAINISNKEQVEKFFAILSEREKQVMMYRFGFYDKQYTLEEVGQKFNVTRERIRQVEAKALRKMRNLVAQERKKNEEKKALEEKDITAQISRLCNEKYNIYYKFEQMGYSEDVVDEAIGRLTKSEQSKLYSALGFDLHNPIINFKYNYSQAKLNFIVNNIIDKRLLSLVKIVSMERKKTEKESINVFDRLIHTDLFTNDYLNFVNSKSMYDFFEKIGYSKEQVTVAISETYSADNMYMLNFCYTDGFNKPISKFITEEEKKDLYNSVINGAIIPFLESHCVKNEKDKIKKLNLKDQLSNQNMV